MLFEGVMKIEFKVFCLVIDCFVINGDCVMFDFVYMIVC